MSAVLTQLNPQIQSISRFRSTARTPNSEKWKNQYCCRVMIWIDGAATLDWDHRSESVSENDILYLVPNVPYRIRNTNGEFEVLNIWFTDRPKAAVPTGTIFADAFDPIQAAGIPDFAAAPELAHAALLKNRPALCRMWRDCAGMPSDTPARELAYRAGILQILSEMLEPAAAPADPRTAQLLQYIRSHITEPLSGAELAAVFHYHRKTIGQWVKQATGVPLHRYILHQKCVYARQLMQETDMSVTDIAHLLSFYDYSHLMKCMKQDAHFPDEIGGNGPSE